MTNPSVRDYTATGATGNRYVTVSVPAATVAGDLLVLVHGVWDATGPIPQIPSGWTTVNNVGDSTSNNFTAVKKATAADITAGTVTIDDITAGNSETLLVAVADAHGTLRTSGYARSATGATSWSVTTGAAAAVGDLGLYVSILHNTTATASIATGTALAGRTDNNTVLAANTETATTAAAITEAFGASSAPTRGYYSVVLVASPATLSDTYTAFTASGDNAGSGEGVAQAFDGDTATKWLTFANTGWIQVQLSTAATIYSYSLTSANDSAGRDPKDWQFQGSADGSTFTTLDTQTNQVFASRFQTNRYSVASPGSYTYYRLNITANSGDADIQLAELALSNVAPQTVDLPVIDSSGTVLVATPAVHYHVDAPVIGVLAYFASAPQLTDLPGVDVTGEIGKPVSVNPTVPIDATADMGVAVDSTPIRVDVPVIAARMGLFAAGFQRMQRIPIQPAAGATVPMLQPMFEVDFTQIEGTLDAVDVYIEYGTPADFSDYSNVIIYYQVDIQQGVNVVRAQAADPLTAGTWFWRIRVGDGDWTAPHSFTLTDGGGDDTVTVNAFLLDESNATGPVIWYVTPTTGVVGDEVTIYGQGFSDLQGTVRLGDTPMDIQTWATRIESDPGSGVRVIDFAAGRVGCEHDEVTAVVPAAATVGDYALIVTDPL